MLTTFFVTTEADSLEGICVADNEAASINCSLRAAIQAAADNPGPATVVVPDGTYLLEFGTLEVAETDALTILGNRSAPESVVIDAQGGHNVFDLLASFDQEDLVVDVVLEGLTIQNGSNDFGGGIESDSSVALTVRHSILRNNFSAPFSDSPSDGGAIDAFGTLIIDSVQFIDNIASGAGGGISWSPSGDQQLTITDSVFRGNQAQGDSFAFDLGGGGIYIELSESAGEVAVEISDTLFEGNTAAMFGGGILVSSEDPLGTDAAIMFSDVTFIDNQALIDGGGAALFGYERFSQQGGRYENNAAGDAGGGLYLFGAGPATVDGVTFEDNETLQGGGGLAVNSPVTINNSVFRSNRVTAVVATDFSEGGGGLSVATDDVFGPAVSAEINDSLFEGNSAPLAGGIGIANASVSITGSSIIGNQATAEVGGAGGIGIVNDQGFAGSLSVSASTITGNTSSANAGGIGAVDARVEIVDSTLDGNTAQEDGGGIGIAAFSTATFLGVIRSTVSNNFAAGMGGGIGAIATTLFSENATISGNEASQGGGGIAYLSGDGGGIVEGNVNSTTIASNRTGGSGSNVLTDLTIGILSSLIADPQGTGPGAVNFLANPPDVIESLGFNLDSDGSGGLDAEGDLSNIDPRIGPLAGNGGPVQTHALLRGSPAIDAGDDSLLETDARGFPRPQDGRADGEARNDIGAFEADELILQANDDSFTIDAGPSVLLDVLANDVTNQPPLRIITVVQPPEFGTAEIEVVGDGQQIRYTPDPGFVGDDSFSYAITNSPIGVDTPSATATVSLRVVGDQLTFIPDPPVVTTMGTSLAIEGDTLTANDVAGSGGGPVVISSVVPQSSAGGSVTLEDQTLTYQPPAEFVGQDRIFYEISDGISIDDTALLDINVLPAQVAATISGQIVCDINGNRMVDPGEEAAGVPVFVDFNGNRLRDAGEPQTLTDALGRFSFEIPLDLLPGHFDVVAEVPAGCVTINPFPVQLPPLGIGTIARAMAPLPAADSAESAGQRVVVVNEISGDAVIAGWNPQGGLDVLDDFLLGGRLSSVDVFHRTDPETGPIIVAGDVGTTAGGHVHLIDVSQQSITTIPLADGPIDVQVGDFNGNGLPDVLVAGLRGSQLGIIWGGTDQLQMLGQIDQLVAVAVGDFDGDGIQDVAIAGNGSALDGAGIGLLLGRGDETFDAVTPLRTGGGDILQLEAVDLNGDGRSQLLALGRRGRLMTLGLDDDQLVVDNETLITSTANRFVVGNFNGDSQADIAYANRRDSKIEFLVGTPSGQFVSYTEIYNVATPSAMVATDLTGDGIDELLVTSALTPDPDGGFTNPPSTLTAFRLNLAVQTVSVAATEGGEVDFLFPSADPEVLLDINRDGQVTPLDALVVLNAIAEGRGEGEAVASASPPARFDTDVNRDGQTTPLDALIILNWLSSHGRAAGGEGERADAIAVSSSADEVPTSAVAPLLGLTAAFQQAHSREHPHDPPPLDALWNEFGKPVHPAANAAPADWPADGGWIMTLPLPAPSGRPSDAEEYARAVDQLLADQRLQHV